jgi:hypothetical protein
MQGNIFGRVPQRMHIYSRNPWANIPRFPEGCATDTLFSTVTSYEGYNCMQWFVMMRSKFQNNLEWSARNKGSGSDALLVFLRTVGAPLSIQRDNSKMQVSHLWQEYMRQYNRKDEYTKPYHPWKNPAERRMAPDKDRIARMIIIMGCDL